MSQRDVIVRVEREISEALPKATGETARLLKLSQQGLARIIRRLPEGTERLSTEQRLDVFESVMKRLEKVSATDALIQKAIKWRMDLLEWL